MGVCGVRGRREGTKGCWGAGCWGDIVTHTRYGTLSHTLEGCWFISCMNQWCMHWMGVDVVGDDVGVVVVGVLL